jgi:hypothetical protein
MTLLRVYAVLATMVSCWSTDGPVATPDSGRAGCSGGVMSLDWQCDIGCHTDAPFVYLDTVVVGNRVASWLRSGCPDCNPVVTEWPRVPFSDSSEIVGCAGPVEVDGRVWDLRLTEI